MPAARKNLAGGGYVKAWSTKTAVSHSQSDIRKMLARYGATAVSMSEDMEKNEIVVTFVVPDKPGSAARIPIRLPISIRSVGRAIYSDNISRGSPKFEQAERVAWRNLFLWIDAALSASSIGLQTITEAFFAHSIVGPNGQRMIELVEEAQTTLGPGVQRLLTSTVDQ